MKFFLKCVTFFVGLIAILTIVDQLILESSRPFGATLFFSTTISLFATLIYGWIDEVYINQRNPLLEE